MTRRPMLILNLTPYRFFHFANIFSDGAARMEMAARRGINGAGNPALQNNPLPFALGGGIGRWCGR